MTALTLAPLFKRKHSGSHNMSWRKIPKLPTRLSKRRNSSSETIDVVTAPAPSFSLADLPGELVRGIVSYLDYAEVRTLRLVCRDFNELVTAPNCEVMRHLVNHQLKHIPRPIAQPAACEADWDRILQRTRRWDFAEALSAELLLYVQYKIPIHHNVQRVLRFPPQAKNIQAKMTPLLFTLSEYLSTCQSHLMEMASEDDVSLECQARLDAHTVALLETTPSDQIQDLHGMWLFLMGVLNFVLARPSYAGTVERTLRGWTADPLDRCSLARVLVFGNVPAILKILSLGHYAERKKWARQHLKSLDPDHGPEWSDSWAKGDVGFNGDIPRAQAAKATKLDILMHCLWTQGAKLVLDKTGHSLSEDELKPTNANTITFLSKLAGCDTLTTPISAFNEHSVNNDHSRTNGADDNQTRSTFSSLEFTEMDVKDGAVTLKLCTFWRKLSARRVTKTRRTFTPATSSHNLLVQHYGERSASTFEAGRSPRAADQKLSSEMAPSKRRRTIEDDGDSTDNGEEVVDVQPVRQRPKQKKSRLAQAQENGGSVVSDEDSLPDDTVYAERQSHQGAADPNDTEDEDLELEQEIRDEYVSRNADGRENQPADHGVIEEVYCENFMCHNKLRIKLGPLLNFIVGHNGSGKSAVLTALTICLGVKATATNRGGSLKKFIKEGCESAMIRVRIKNQGSQAYQPEVYGDSIVVERQFNKQGASNFKLKSAQDRIISTKRAELDDILDCLALQLDNPLNVLTQDLARQFLSSSTPTQKYGFFMKGTQLQQLDRDYREMARSIDETEAKLDNRTEDIAHLKRKVDQAAEKKKAMDSIDTLRDQIDKLTYQHAWAQVGDVESNVAQYQKEMDKAEERIRERKDNANAKSDAFSSMDANVEAAKQLKQDFEAEMQPLKEKQENVKKEFNIGTKKLSENLAMARSIKTDLRSAQVDKARAEAKLAEEEARMEAASGPAQAAKLAELKAAENDLKDAKEAQTSQESRQGLDRDRQTAQTKVITREEARNNAKEKVRDAERMLNNLRNKDDDRMKAFHHKMPSVLREIRNESRFRVKPVGPMGMHVQLKKPEWSLIVESIFGKSLESFVVTSAHDQTILRSILLKHGLPGDIFVGNARPLDITNQKAVTNDDTLLSILEIDNDLVRNQFIINQAIEQTVMIKKRSTASALMDSPNKPRNAKILICMHDTQHGEGHRFTMSASGKRIDRVSKWQGSIRMKTEMEGQIRNQQEAVTHAKRNEETAQQELRAAQQELEVAKQAVNRWERRAKELKLAKQTAEDDQERITEELKAFDIQAGSLDVFKVQITEAEESIALASNSYTDSVNEKDSINTAQRKIKAELDKADAAMEEMAIKLTKVDKSINRHVDTRMAALREKNLACKQVEDAEKQLQEWTTKKADEEEKLVEFTNMATQISPRVPVDRGMTVDKIDAKLERLKREQDAAEGAVGASREEIMERYVRAQEEYRNASNGLKLLEDTCKRLKMSYKLRNARWQEFRKYITARAMIMFAVLLNERGFKGRLICSHHTKQLDIAVEPDTTQTSDKGRQAKTLSGGEKSFATICLLLAIWEAMGSPIRCLDEFDVFMDPVNRETSMRMMIQAARRATGKQYILITPQNMGNVPVNGYTSIHKMSDPERGQTTIPYQ